MLANDTKFKLTTGSLGSIEVDLWASNTSSNSNLSDLANDLQSVIDAELRGENIDAVIEVRVISGDRIGLFTENTTFMKIENNSVTDSESKGGFELLGFWDGQIGTNTPTPANGIISGDATFNLTLGTTVYQVFLDKDNTTDNDIGDKTDKSTKIGQLVGDIQNAIDSALGGSTGLVDVTQLGDRFSITLGTTTETFIQISSPNDVAFKELGVPKNQISAEVQILGERYLSIEGNHLDSDIVDYGKLEEIVELNLKIDDEPVTVTLYAANLKVLGFVCNQFVTGNLTAPYNISDPDMYGPAPGVDV